MGIRTPYGTQETVVENERSQNDIGIWQWRICLVLGRMAFEVCLFCYNKFIFRTVKSVPAALMTMNLLCALFMTPIHYFFRRRETKTKSSSAARSVYDTLMLGIPPALISMKLNFTAIAYRHAPPGAVILVKSASIPLSMLAQASFWDIRVGPWGKCSALCASISSAVGCFHISSCKGLGYAVTSVMADVMQDASQRFNMSRGVPVHRALFYFFVWSLAIHTIFAMIESSYNNGEALSPFIQCIEYCSQAVHLIHGGMPLCLDWVTFNLIVVITPMAFSVLKTIDQSLCVLIDVYGVDQSVAASLLGEDFASVLVSKYLSSDLFVLGGVAAKILASSFFIIDANSATNLKIEEF